MEQVAAFMLLVGCNGDVAVCKELPVSVPAYESVEACQDDLPIQIRMSGVGDKRVYGACTAVSPDVFERSASIEWAISRGGKLVVEFDAEDGNPRLVASR